MTDETSQLSSESSPHRINANTSTSATTMNVVCVVTCRVGQTTRRISRRASLARVPQRLPPLRLQGNEARDAREDDERQHAAEQRLLLEGTNSRETPAPTNANTTSHFR